MNIVRISQIRTLYKYLATILGFTTVKPSKDGRISSEMPLNSRLERFCGGTDRVHKGVRNLT